MKNTFFDDNSDDHCDVEYDAIKYFACANGYPATNNNVECCRKRGVIGRTKELEDESCSWFCDSDLDVDFSYQTYMCMLHLRIILYCNLRGLNMTSSQ